MKQKYTMVLEKEVIDNLRKQAVNNKRSLSGEIRFILEKMRRKQSLS